MTLAALAGEELTRQAIHLIETGRARPSLPVLELIAERTGKPLNHFLLEGVPGQPVLDHPRLRDLQWLCLDRRYADAVKLGTQLLERRLPRRSDAEARYYVGQSMVQLGRADEAVGYLEAALSQFDKLGDPWLAVECLDWLAGAFYTLEDPRALETAEQALRRCQALDPPLPRVEARILEHLATIHVRDHAIDLAVSYYEAALAAADKVRDLGRLARTYHGLSIAYQERGYLEKASELASKALALYALEHDQLLTARAENELGVLLMRQGQLDRAQDLFESAAGRFGEATGDRVKSHVLLSLAEVKLQRGDVEAAEQQAREALELAASLDERLAMAAAHQLLGQIQARAHKPRRADKEFEAAIQILEQLGTSERLAEAHAAFAESLEQRGGGRAAGAHWRMAAQLSLPNGSAGRRLAPKASERPSLVKGA